MSDPGCEIEVVVQPRSSQNKVERIQDRWKVWVTAPPTDGQANEAVCALLAKNLRISKSSVRLTRGQSGRRKRFAIDGLSQSEVLARLGGG
jgi:uncharacterized protein (TIGR00251 family)